MLTTTQKRQLNEISIWKPVSFPNGSAYKMQTLPEGNHNGIEIERVYGQGYFIRWSDETESIVEYEMQSVGPGTDFGAHFCSRDQALADLA